jgi:hypothetical protein
MQTNQPYLASVTGVSQNAKRTLLPEATYKNGVTTAMYKDKNSVHGVVRFPNNQPPLIIPASQIVNPTTGSGLTDEVIQGIQSRPQGSYHLIWNDDTRKLVLWPKLEAAGYFGGTKRAQGPNGHQIDDHHIIPQEFFERDKLEKRNDLTPEEKVKIIELSEKCKDI